MSFANRKELSSFHNAAFGIRVDLETDNCRNDPMQSYLYHLSPFLRRCLSLSVKMNGKLADYHLSETYRQNEAIYDIILLKDVDKLILICMMVEIMLSYCVVGFSLLSCGNASRYSCFIIQN